MVILPFCWREKYITAFWHLLFRYLFLFSLPIFMKKIYESFLCKRPKPDFQSLSFLFNHMKKTFEGNTPLVVSSTVPMPCVPRLFKDPIFSWPIHRLMNSCSSEIANPMSPRAAKLLFYKVPFTKFESWSDLSKRALHHHQWSTIHHRTEVNLTFIIKIKSWSWSFPALGRNVCRTPSMGK